MASCLPVISTPAGGNPLLVGDAGCGKVVPFGDWRSLSQATDDVLTSPTLRASFCRNGRKFAEHELRDDIIMSKHIKLYDSVCEER
jgi:glycosyltransferase involved in cell wall biosynthesis